jgi:hypothetical protein
MIMDFEKIFNEAVTAAVLASNEAEAKHGDNGACGFAWVDIPDGRSKFVSWLKSQIKFYLRELKDENSQEYQTALRDAERLYGSKHWTKGWYIWNPSKSNVQSIHVKELGAVAFANVLRSHGIVCYASSRLD